MDNETNVLEVLVKLASLGAAGIGIVGIFYTAIIVRGLPNDVTPAKLASVKLLTKLCIITVIVCGISGVCNSYFSMKKIQDAKNQTTEITKQYNSELNNLQISKAAINKDLTELRAKLSGSTALPQGVTNTLDNAVTKVNSLKLKPTSDILKKDPK
jgi:cell division protein FtsL